MKNSSIETQSNIISSELRDLAEDHGISTRGGVIEIKSGSKLLPLKIGLEKRGLKEPKFTHENLKNLGAQLNLSDKGIM